jgi:hypothetical protein
MSEASDDRPASERSDADPRLIAALALGATAFLALTPYGLRWLYPPVKYETSVRMTVSPPAPRLQIDPRRDLKAVQATESSQLSSYGWANRPGGVVHIPIDRAMQLTAQRGLPGWRKP